jgi:allophanate hydrolase
VNDRRVLADAYAAGTLPSLVMLQTVAEIVAGDPVWISRVDPETVMARAYTLDACSAAERAALPLYGVPFAVKDNIDVAGMPTTAACPEFAYVPERSATVVERLEAAGAILVGKTNLDQFATGLVGTRSPYGVPKNPHDARYIPGGSTPRDRAACRPASTGSSV